MRPAGQDGLGRRRLCVALVHRPLDTAREAPARPRARPRLVRHRSRCARALGVELHAGRQDAPARQARDPGEARRARARRGGVCHGRGRRCRHSQPDPITRCRSRASISSASGRSASRDPRPLRLPDRRHAGRAGAIRSGGDAGGGLKADTPTRSRSRAIRASSRSAPTAPRRSASTCRPSTARCA